MVTPSAVQADHRSTGDVLELHVEQGSYAVSVDGSSAHELHDGGVLRVTSGAVRLVDATVE
jgi:quercetin dioxygenase-like cupin family protein